MSSSEKQDGKLLNVVNHNFYSGKYPLRHKLTQIIRLIDL